jgi:hypothetical protein
MIANILRMASVVAGFCWMGNALSAPTNWGFLTRSKYLQSQSMQIYLAHVGADSVVINSAVKNNGLIPYLLTDQGGVIELTLSPTSSKKDRKDPTCHNPKSFLFKPKDQSKAGKVLQGGFVVFAKQMPADVKFFRAKKLSQLPSAANCVKSLKGYELAEIAAFENPTASDEIFYYANWQKQSQSQECNELYAEEITGVFSRKANTCRVLHKRRLDCDGQAIDSKLAAIHDFRGILRVGSETWYLFDSVEYEAEGTAAVQLDGKGEIDWKSLTVDRSGGC